MTEEAPKSLCMVTTCLARDTLLVLDEVAIKVAVLAAEAMVTTTATVIMYHLTRKATSVLVKAKVTTEVVEDTT